MKPIKLPLTLTALFMAASISIRAADSAPPPVGKPVDISFTALDGKKVNLKDLKGKVVLIDFWATWCTICMEEMPNVKAAYQKYHPQGFEIVGISLDEKKSLVTKYLAKEKIPWPQYFDGLEWKNKFAKRFAVEELPTMWLIDKRGNVRDLDAKDKLYDRIKELLAENVEK